MKIFQMNDCDWYAGETAEDALRAMAENMCFETTPEGIAAMRKEYEVEPVELDDTVLDSLTFMDTDEQEKPIARRSFREQLALMIEQGSDFPCMFASAEF